MTIGLLPHDPIAGETMTWDIKHMLDIENFIADANRQTNIIQEVSCNELKVHVRLNKWKSVNGLMDVQDGANSPNMQDVLRLIGLAIGNHNAFVPKRLGRQK